VAVGRFGWARFAERLESTYRRAVAHRAARR
jgi:hypothetical protein